MKRDYEIIVGDCRDVLASLPESSAHCVITSPPYYALRDYGVGGQIGLETSLDEYLAGMVAVFRQVRRVLRDDGTLWLNMGDTYGSHGCGTGGRESFRSKDYLSKRTTNLVSGAVKAKDLIGVPWRLAFALQADGWWLRSDIIYHKPNPMPESCTDRPTKAHEYLFLLTKRARYFYDPKAVCEQSTDKESLKGRRLRNIEQARIHDPAHTQTREFHKIPEGKRYPTRNLRTVWTIPTESFAGAHFATYPRKLVTPCIKAGTSEKGCCPACGAPWRRVIDKCRRATRPARNNCRDATGMANRDYERHVTESSTVGWQAPCKCGGEPISCTVLDPFSGSGTTGVVATQLGRRYVGIELNPEYAAMSRRRIENPEPLPEIPDVPGQMALFDDTVRDTGDSQWKRTNVP